MMSHNIELLVDYTTSGFILDENNKFSKSEYLCFAIMEMD